MKLEEAEYMINMNLCQCSGCPMYTPITGHCVAQSCADAVQEAAKTVITSRDARIAELEKERDEAREDAITTADKLARLSLRLIDGIVDHEKSGDYFKYGIKIIGKYK